MKKLCPDCNTRKARSEFYALPHTSDGLGTRCKPCQRAYVKRHRQTPRGRAVAAWHDLFKKIKQPAYRGIEVRIEKEVFLEWAEREFAEWERKHPDERPSVDREDPDGHYEIDNIRVISLVENIRRKRDNHNVHAPEGKAWCARCLEYKDRDQFSVCRRNSHGLQNHCKPCMGIREKAARRPKTSGSADTRG